MNAPIDKILPLLHKVKKTKPNQWVACCPAHKDKSPSLSVRNIEDDRLLLHCFGGCSTPEILAALGLEISDLFPEKESHHGKPITRPFPAADILRALAFETTVVAVAGAALLSGKSLTEADRARLMLAVERIQSGLTAGGLNHGW